MSGCVPLCLLAAGLIELPWAESILFLRMLVLTVTGLFVQDLELAETPASPAFWSSTAIYQVPSTWLTTVLSDQEGSCLCA